MSGRGGGRRPESGRGQPAELSGGGARGRSPPGGGGRGGFGGGRGGPGDGGRGRGGPGCVGRGGGPVDGGGGRGRGGPGDGGRGRGDPGDGGRGRGGDPGDGGRGRGGGPGDGGRGIGGGPADGGRGIGGGPADGGRGIGGGPADGGRGIGGGPADGGRGRGSQVGGGRGVAPPPHITPAVANPVAPHAISSQAANPSTRPAAGTSSTPSSSGTVESLSHDVGKLALQSSAPDPAPVRPPPSSLKAITIPSRPGYGKAGKKIVVRANHFLVQVADRDLHHYDVSITPEVISKKMNRLIISQLVKEYRESHLGGRMPAYDGRKSLYTAGALPFESKEFVIKYVDDDAAPGSSRRERVFKVAVKYAAKADLHHLQQFLSGRQLDSPQETVQALDVVLRAAPSEKYTVVGRSFFSLQLGKNGELGDGLEFWRGYYQSLRPTQMGLSLNIDVSARSFYEPLVVTDFVSKHMHININRPLIDQDRIKLKKALKGLKVQLKLLERRRMYKITGVSSKPLGQLTFTLEEEKRTISVVQYYREKYNMNLKYTTLPALQSGNDSRPTYLPMEICWIVEGQRYTKKLNERQVTNLLRATCQRPREREASIKEMVYQNNYATDTRVDNEFGIQVGLEMKLVDARVLPPPMLKYHETGQQKVVGPVMGTWNMKNLVMVNGGTVDCWTCINFSRLNRDVPFNFCGGIVDMCSRKGMRFNPDPVIEIQSVQPNRIERVLYDIHRQCDAILGPQKKHLQLLIIILPEVTGTYGMIKRICETELGIVSQCCQPRNVAKMNIQYLENLSLKINVKVGGRNNVLNDAILKKIPLLSDRPTIIFGADVTHPQPGEDSCPSIAAVVASMDWPEVTKYRGLVSAQTHRDEIIEDLYKKVHDPKRGIVHGGMIRELLIGFYKSTGYKPDRILFYRDGVSEGQFSQVLLYEIDAIRKACASMQDGYMPPITFVVVQKRHHTRLFPADHNKHDSTDKSGNIQPGTVVDTSICHPTQFDFYLNSHAGIQGTSRPAHYHVLYDENKYSADLMQMLTNSLCYTYARCTRSVSIVPPAYYAHLAAFRARYYIEGDTSDGGSTSAGSKNTRDPNVQVRPLPAIKDNVKNVMFYC